MQLNKNAASNKDDNNTNILDKSIPNYQILNNSAHNKNNLKQCSQLKHTLNSKRNEEKVQKNVSPKFISFAHCFLEKQRLQMKELSKFRLCPTSTKYAQQNQDTRDRDVSNISPQKAVSNSVNQTSSINKLPKNSARTLIKEINSKAFISNKKLVYLHPQEQSIRNNEQLMRTLKKNGISCKQYLQGNSAELLQSIHIKRKRVLDQQISKLLTAYLEQSSTNMKTTQLYDELKQRIFQ